MERNIVSVIRLDWDNICWKQMETRIEAMKKNIHFREIDVKESSHLGGYHIRAKTFYKLKPMAVFNMRYDFLDDPKRLVRDTIGIGEDLLFAFKKDKKRDSKGNVYASFLWQSTDLFKMVRDSKESEWQKINKKNTQICIPKQSDSLQQSQQLLLQSVNQEFSNNV